MKTIIKREDLVNKLNQASLGLAQLGKNQTVDHSDCFIFKGKFLYTYNEEILCRLKSGMEVEKPFAIPAANLMQLVQKMQDEQLRITVKDEIIIVNGLHSQKIAKIPKDVGVSFVGIKSVETPEEWKDLPSVFSTALEIGSSCAKSSHSFFVIRCVRITPKYMESTDNDQVVRYRVKTGISDCLILKDAALKIKKIEPSEYAETENWLHFKNGTGVVYAVKKYETEKYPKLKEVLDLEGTPVRLNKGLSLSTELASIFARTDIKGEDAQVLVSVSNGQIGVKGEGSSGVFEDTLPFKYKGKPFQFVVNPKMFSELTSKNTDCEISKCHMKVSSQRFTYVACLISPKEAKKVLPDEKNEEE